MSDVTILRRAASALRERAGNATPGPWERSTHYGYKIVSQTLTVGHVNPPEPIRPARLRAVIESTNAANAEYLALMHPPVALALADWLDDEAARGLGKPDNVAAYAVARAVLREACE